LKNFTSIHIQLNKNKILVLRGWVQASILLGGKKEMTA
jgi:hypothetical protein